MGSVVVSGRLSSSKIRLGDGVRRGWWLVVPGSDGGIAQVVAGPFADRAEAGWAVEGHADGVQTVYGVRHGDGVLKRRPSPQEWAWLAHLGGQLDRLPEDWDAVLSDEDPMTTLVVEVAAAICEAGLPLHDATGADREVGGACLTPEPTLGGILVSWRQHDRMSVDRVHGAAADAAVQHAMNRALADVLTVRGFDVDPVGGGSGSFVRTPAC
jgi:hypothetical protein